MAINSLKSSSISTGIKKSKSDLRELTSPSVVSFNSFGIYSGQTKSTSYTSYTGSSPTGTKFQQYTRMTPSISGRPGGLTYTDILLDGDFFICFYTVHGGDYYNAVFLYDENYNTFTHTALENATRANDYGYQSRYGVYIQPGQFAIWDGINQSEGSTTRPLVAGMTTTGYLGIRRSGGTFYTYYSNSAPGASGYTAMNLVHTSTTSQTGRVRLGLFVHDASDYLEVYSPGTFINKYSNFVSGHVINAWTMATNSSGNRSLNSGNYFALETSSSYKYAMSSYDTSVNRPASFWTEGPISAGSYFRVSGGSPVSDSFEFYFAGKECVPTNMTFYMYPDSIYTPANIALQYWNGSSWTTAAGLGNLTGQSGWSVRVDGVVGDATYTTPNRNAVSFTFSGNQTAAYEFRSKYWRIWSPLDAMSGNDKVWHNNGVGPLNFWIFS